jgi:hypothetical protein
MFLRPTVRKKDGKEHTYYSIVENKRVADGRVVQRHVLYLGEINSSQQLAWRRSIEVFDEAQPHAPRTVALFPEDRYEAAVGEEDVVRLRLWELRLERPRQWGGCWLAVELWRELGLDTFWAARLRQFGYSRDHRPDCVQVVIALVVTPQGLLLAGTTNRLILGAKRASSERRKAADRTPPRRGTQAQPQTNQEVVWRGKERGARSKQVACQKMRKTRRSPERGGFQSSSTLAAGLRGFGRKYCG